MSRLNPPSEGRSPSYRMATKSRSTSHLAASIFSFRRTKSRVASQPGNLPRRNTIAATDGCSSNTSNKPTSVAISIFSGAAVRNRLLLIAFFAAAALGFYIINHGAYHGYFQADSLDNIALDHAVGWGDIVKPMVLPTVPDQNFRPVGALFLRLLGNAAGLRFPTYIAAIHILHFLNALLVYFVLRKLGLPTLAACAGSIFFLFHMALFGVLWEPMFVFDLLCGLFCLLSLLTYIDGHWIVSFVLFWLAYRSKENAIMLPIALAAWEFVIGPKIWRRLIPCFALSAILDRKSTRLN